jgi:UPF0755 protein
VPTGTAGAPSPGGDEGADETSGQPTSSSAPPSRPRSRRRRRILVVLGVAALAVVGVVVAGALWYEDQVNEGPPGPAVIVDVPAGSSLSAITTTLGRDGVVGSSLALRIYLFLHGNPTVSAGRYQLHRNDDFAAVRARLAGGPDVFELTVVPGTTVAELSSAIDRGVPSLSGPRFLAAASSGTIRSPWQPVGSVNLDGLLGPGSYTVVPGETETDLLQKMIARFDAEADADDLAAAAAADDGVTPYAAITVASIVQKEAISPGDSAAATAHNVGPVARVVYNRLNRGMPLQMDSTVLYAEGRDGGPVTPADESTPTPYNTYLHVGLTPTPICFPSALALDAALHPPPGDWLYFELTSADGTETFSVTFAEQQAAEALAHSRGLP